MCFNYFAPSIDFSNVFFFSRFFSLSSLSRPCEGQVLLHHNLQHGS